MVAASLSVVTPRERIAAARLYLVCDARPRAFLEAALRGGADVVQLRDKTLGDDALIAAAREFRAAADAHGALFVLNDRPDLVAACRADGVHVGQDDGSPAAARAVAGPDAIVGRSTHAPEQGAAADADPDVDYLAVGPVHATPTKPGRPAAGPEYVRWAAEHVATPWFAIGGLDARHHAGGRRARRPPHRRRARDHGRRRPGGRRPRAARRASRRPPLGQRSRKRRPPSRAPSATPRCAAATRAAASATSGSARELAPLAPGERPPAIKVAVALAALLAISNLALFAAGWEVRGQDQAVTGVLIFCALMLAAAVGMWRMRYWAVLGFQALLGIAVDLRRREPDRRLERRRRRRSAWRILAIAGTLFWFLVRVMARIQLPHAASGGAGRLAYGALCPRALTTASSSDPGREGTWRRSARPSSA